MNQYWFDDINAIADCEDICTALGIAKTGKGRYASPHSKSGKSTAMHVQRLQWYDHNGSEKRGGGPIELVEYLRNCSSAEAMEWLGEHYNLTPFRVQEPAVDRRIVKVYDYCDPETNAVVHQTVRFEPKDFAQRRPAPPGSEKPYIWNLRDIEPILYRIRDWKTAKWVCVCGGEKDVDNLLALGIPATTNPMGEGHWRDAYNRWLEGKEIVLIPDNDDAGELHRKAVLASAGPVVAGARTLRLPDLAHKGDVSDWIESGGTKDQFLALLKGLPQEDMDAIPPVDDADKAMMDRLTIARKANTVPFRNYSWVTVGDGDDKKRHREPISCRALVKDIHDRFLGFPVCLGDQLVDWDRDANKLRVIATPADLTSWMRMAGGVGVDISKEPGMVSAAELMSALLSSATRYEAVTHAPHWPLRDDTLYTFRHSVHFQGWPEPDPDMEALCRLCDMLSPHEPADDSLMQILFAAPLYYRPGVKRPSWVIDAVTGQGSGKSTVAEMVAYLYLCHPIIIYADQIRAEQMGDRLVRRILTERGRQSRVAMIDNIDQTGFKSASISSMIASDVIAGLRPYGSTEEVRPNDMTWILTMNTMSIDEDLADRSLMLSIRREPGPRKMTVREIREFIDENRWQILSDIIAKLEAGPQWKVTPSLRDQEFEAEVMAPIIGDRETFEDVVKVLMTRRRDANNDLADAETIESYIYDRLKEMGVATDAGAPPAWITSNVLIRWAQEAIKGFGGSGRNVPRMLVQWAKKGNLKMLHRTETGKWPMSGRRKQRRGMVWYSGDDNAEEALLGAVDPVVVAIDHSTMNVSKVRTSEI